MRIVKGELYQQLELDGEILIPQTNLPPLRYRHMIIFVRKEAIKENQLIYDTIALADFVVADGVIIKNAWGR